MDVIVSPKGKVKFQNLPSGLLNLSALPKFVENGQIKGSVNGQEEGGILLIYDKEIIACSWANGQGGKYFGVEAMHYWEKANDILITAEGLDENIVHSLPVIWSETKDIVELNYGWLVSLEDFMLDVAQKKAIVAIVLEDEASYGAALYFDGKYLLSYTNVSDVNTKENILQSYPATKKTKVRVKSVPTSHFWRPLAMPKTWTGQETPAGVNVVKGEETEMTTPMTFSEDTLAPFGGELVAEDVETSLVASDEDSSVNAPSLWDNASDDRDENDTDIANHSAFEEKTAEENAPIELADLLPNLVEDDEEDNQLGESGLMDESNLRTNPPTMSVTGGSIFDDDEDLRPIKNDMELEKYGHQLVDNGIISQEDVIDEIRSRRSKQAKSAEENNVLNMPLSLSIVSKLRNVVTDTLPPASAKAVMDIVSNIARQGQTFEDLIEQIGAVRINMVTQRQLDNLIDAWKQLLFN